MPRHTLYAYVCGSDLNNIETDVLSRFDSFISNREWVCKQPHSVNQRHPADPSLKAGDRPDWDLGLNMPLPDPGHEQPGWYSDVVAIAEFLAAIAGETPREFVIGIHDGQAGTAEDLHYIKSADPALDRLRAIIGVGEKIDALEKHYRRDCHARELISEAIKHIVLNPQVLLENDRQVFLFGGIRLVPPACARL